MSIDHGYRPPTGEQVLQCLTGPALLLDDGQVVRAANAPARQRLGADEQALVGRRLSDVLPGPAVDTAWDQLVQGEQDRVVRTAGAVYDLSALREDGSLTGAVLSGRPDPGPFSRLDRALELSPLCLVAFDGHGVVSFVGGSAFASIGVDASRTLGRDVLEVFGRTPQLEGALRRCLDGEEFDTVFPFAGRVWDLHVRPVLDAGGHVDGGLCIAQDVTAWLPVTPPDRRPAAPAVAEPDPGVEEAELRTALARGQFDVEFQPLVRVRDRRGAGGEALLRWEHPTLGRRRPADFLRVAEASGLLLPIGDRVLRQACHVASGWNRDEQVTSSAGGDLQVSVNLTGRQLLQPGLVGLVREALQVADCRPSWLLVEVPESAVVGGDSGQREVLAQALRALDGLGVELALDDAPGGGVTARCLREHPFDVVKLRRSAIQGFGGVAPSTDVVAQVVSTAHRLGVRVVAKGVEAPAQLGVLVALGCDLAQGNLFSRPLPHDQATAWLRRSGSVRLLPRPPLDRGPAPGVAQRVLELDAAGASPHTIAARLNVEGLRTESGRRWHHVSVSRFLSVH